MECRYSKFIDEMLEGRLGEKKEMELRKHAKGCIECSSKLDAVEKEDMIFKHALERFPFESQKEIIVEKAVSNGKSLLTRMRMLQFRKVLLAISLILILAAALLIFKTSFNKDTPTVTDNSISEIIKSREGLITNIIDDMKSESLGAVPWTVFYSGSGRIILYNYTYMLAYSNSKDGVGFYGALDLKKIDANHMQGSIYTVFSPSPDGNCVVIGNINSDDRSSKSNMYFYDIIHDKNNVLSVENRLDITDSWSNSSRYYAFADRIQGDKITLYDAKDNSTDKIPLPGGPVKRIFVSDNGTILVDSDKKYILKASDSYKIGELNITGDIIGFNGEDFYYFDKGIIYKYNNGSPKEIRKPGSSFHLAAVKSNYAIFTDDGTSWVFNTGTSDIYKFNIPYDSSIKFSPDLTRYLSSNSGGVKVTKLNGDTCGIDDTVSYFDYSWLDNGNLVLVTQKNDSNMLGDFQILKKNIETGMVDVLYESPASGSEKNNEVSPYAAIKGQVSMFDGKSYAEIQITRDGVHDLNNGHKTYTLNDGQYSYDVYDDGSILSIYNSSFETKFNGYISRSEALESAKNIISKLDISMDKYSIEEYNVNADDSNPEHYVDYNFTFRQRDKNSIFTGSYISIDLFGDGQLNTLNIHREKDQSASEKQIRLTREDAKNIILNYMKNHSTLKNYTNNLSDENKFILERSIFYGVPVWYFRTVFKYSSDSILPNEYATLDLQYIIDANTGEFLMMECPPYPEFEEDPIVKKSIERWTALEEEHPDYR